MLKVMTAPAKRDIKWLDGIRGIASFLVVTAHVTRSLKPELLVPQVHPGENAPVLLFQRPFLRDLVMGRASVAVFAILIGYVNAMKPIKLSRIQHYDEGLSYIAKASFRRVGRLGFPTALATLISWILCQMGAFEAGRRSASGWIRNVCPPPARTVMGALRSLWKNEVSTWVFGWNDLDQTQWSLTYLLKGSMMVYLAVAATIYMKPGWRICTMMGLYYYYWQLKDATIGLNVFTGIIIADLSFMPDLQDLIARHHYKRKLICCTLLVLGAYLISYPEAMPEWRPWSAQLRNLGLAWFPNGADISRFYAHIGTTMIVIAVAHSPTMQRLLSGPLFGWMGRVSFHVYLLHSLFLRTIFVWAVFGFSVPPPPTPHPAGEAAPRPPPHHPRDLLHGHNHHAHPHLHPHLHPHPKANAAAPPPPSPNPPPAPAEPIYIPQRDAMVVAMAIPVFYIVLYYMCYQWGERVEPQCARLTAWFERKMFREEEKKLPRSPLPT